MTDQAPPAWFKKQETKSDGDPEFERRKKHLIDELPQLLSRHTDRSRARNFYPYLLIRSVLGDRGDRPINVPFWESPDIWTAPGSPGSAPAVPASHGGTVTAGQPNTVYAHVWNLGFAPLAGIVVEFYWCNPSLSIDATNAHLIGIARCELAGRGMKGSQKLVKCPTAWVPVIENGGHECLVVRVSGIGDPLGNNQWQPWLNRHIGQRNISVVAAATSLRLITALNLSRKPQAHLQLIQLGSKEGEIAVKTVAPGLKIAAKVETHLLGELTAENRIVLRKPERAPPGMLAPVHPLAHGGVPTQPIIKRDREVQVIDPGAVIRNLEGAERAIGTVYLAQLFRSARGLHAQATAHEAPGDGEAHVLRIASYDPKGQLIGGYTMVVLGS
jgi:hypothetical protein